MSFRLLIISSMYPGYLESFYKNNTDVKNLDYNQHHDALLKDSTEFVASYTKTFERLGIYVNCIIDNDIFLQNKWKEINGIKNATKQVTIYNQVKNFAPDILWIEDLRFIDKDLLLRIKTCINSIKLIIAYHCSPYNSGILEKLKTVDFVITCTPGLKNAFEDNGIRSYLVYHGFDSDLLSRVLKGNSEAENKVVFTGSLFQGDGTHSQRIELIESFLRENMALSLHLYLEPQYKIFAKKSIYRANQVLTKLKLEKLKKYFPVFEHVNAPVRNYSRSLIKANLGPVFGLEMYQLLSLSGIVLNTHGEVAGDYAGNMRLFEATGVGSCLLTDNKTNLAELFDTESDIVAYENVDDCIEKARWLLENKVERKKIALAGQQRTLNSHKVEDRVKQIIEIIMNELDEN